MNANDLFFPPHLIRKIVQCVEDAVSDDILVDIQRNNLRTTNSVPARIWDLLNTNIASRLETEDCTVAGAHRGPWEMMVVFEKTSQCIITFMREKRFSDIRRHQRKRTHMHYLDMLAKQFNRELLADQEQIALFHSSFSDEGQLAELVQALLQDLGDSVPLVRHHVLVLFETSGYRLSQIRAVKITSDLNIAEDCDQNWSQFMTATTSNVVEKVENPQSPKNNPTRGLKLTKKATERKKNKPQLKVDSDEQELKQ